MTRKYKGYNITRNMNGKWIVLGLYARMTQCSSLANAKNAINIRLDQIAMDSAK